MTAPLPDAFRFSRVVRFGAAEFRRLMGRQPGECTWCGGPVPKGSRSWCGSACVEEWTIRNQPAVAREKVLARDGGVCASCGADCLARTRRMEAAWTACVATLTHRFAAVPEPIAEAFRVAVFAGTGANLHPCNYGATALYSPPRIPPTWEADHVVPVVEGGGFCGLDGYRTLCVFCHRAETAALAARRAQARREQPADTGQVALFGGDP